MVADHSVLTTDSHTKEKVENTDTETTPSPIQLSSSTSSDKAESNFSCELQALLQLLMGMNGGTRELDRVMPHIPCTAFWVRCFL